MYKVQETDTLKFFRNTCMKETSRECLKKATQKLLNEPYHSEYRPHDPNRVQLVCYNARSSSYHKYGYGKHAKNGPKYGLSLQSAPFGQKGFQVFSYQEKQEIKEAMEDIIAQQIEFDVWVTNVMLVKSKHFLVDQPHTDYPALGYFLTHCLAKNKKYKFSTGRRYVNRRSLLRCFLTFPKAKEDKNRTNVWFSKAVL